MGELRVAFSLVYSYSVYFYHLQFMCARFSGFMSYNLLKDSFSFFTPFCNKTRSDHEVFCIVCIFIEYLVTKYLKRLLTFVTNS